MLEPSASCPPQTVTHVYHVLTAVSGVTGGLLLSPAVPFQMGGTGHLLQVVTFQQFHSPASFLGPGLLIAALNNTGP